MHGFLCSLGFLEAVYYVSLTSHSVCSSHEYFSDEVPARISLPKSGYVSNNYPYVKLQNLGSRSGSVKEIDRCLVFEIY